MTLLKRIKGFVTGLMMLAIACLVTEQLIYLALKPGYYWELLASPVFWGLFSAVCFYLLWRFNRKYHENCVSRPMCDGWKLEGETNPTTGLPMAGVTAEAQ